MRVYVDSSALVKRSVEEHESDALESALEAYLDDGAALVTSALTSIEVSRALLRVAERHEAIDAREAIDVALSGIAERPMSDDIVGLARRLRPTLLRTLDAIQLATAMALDADVVVTYDDRMAEACRQNALRCAAPGR